VWCTLAAWATRLEIWAAGLGRNPTLTRCVRTLKASGLRVRGNRRGVLAALLTTPAFVSLCPNVIGATLGRAVICATARRYLRPRSSAIFMVSGFLIWALSGLAALSNIS
jgi:hypothetical protein